MKWQLVDVFLCSLSMDKRVNAPAVENVGQDKNIMKIEAYCWAFVFQQETSMKDVSYAGV